MSSQTQHPGSAVLSWWEETPKDQEGYGRLSDLVQVLEERTEIRGIAFLKCMSSSKWKREYAWSLELHPFRANRVRIEGTQYPGSPTYVDSGAKAGEVSS